MSAKHDGLIVAEDVRTSFSLYIIFALNKQNIC
jgi:hypothetical protein